MKRILHNQLSRQHGFSLVEILVVTVIIGVLMAILIPALSFMIRKAHDQDEKTRVHNVWQALNEYRSKVGAYPNGAPNTAGIEHLSVTNYKSQMNTGDTILSGMEVLPTRLGYAVRAGGQKVGPFLPVGDNIVAGSSYEGKYVHVRESSTSDHLYQYYVTPKGDPILYYRAIPNRESEVSAGGEVDPTSPKFFWGRGNKFDVDTNYDALDDLGYISPDLAGVDLDEFPNVRHAIESQASLEETTLRAAEALLISPGADRTFGTKDDLIRDCAF